MTTREVTAKELQELDPKRFDRQYYAWLEYAADYDWWEWYEHSFKLDMNAAGVTVDRIGFDSYPWRAWFSGRVDMREFMEHLRLDEKYPALYVAVEQDGSYVTVSNGRYGNAFSLNETLYNTEPDGVFKFLEAHAWEELLNDQLYEASLETEVEEFCATACHQLARDLENDYDHITSVESFIESCECNDVTFEIETDEEVEHEVHSKD